MTLAFFMKWIAPLLAVLAVVGIIYGKGRIDSAHNAELADVQGQLAVAQQSLKTEQAARVSDANAAKEQAEHLSQLNTNIDGLNAYVDALQDANRECLSGADNDRLRQLWR